jgi:hypothetical protein
MLRSLLARVVLFLFVSLTLAMPASAARYHVQPGGLRTDGPSAPDDWTPENCYANVAAAAAVATSADSVLCDDGDHVVDTVVPLAIALLGNRDLSENPLVVQLGLAEAGRFELEQGYALRIQGLSMVGDPDLRTEPAVSGQAGDLQLAGVHFTDLRSDGGSSAGGAALRLTGGGVLTADAVRFAACTSIGRGGAVFLGAGHSAQFTGCEFTGNEATGSGDPRGGALFVDARTAHSEIQLIECELRDNVCGGPGGAVSTLSATITYEDCLVVGNRSGQVNGWAEGAGLHHRRNAGDHTDEVWAIVRRCEFEANVGAIDVAFNGGDGGAFYTSGAPGPLFIHVEVSDSEFRQNFALQGAGVYVSRWSDGVVQRCRFYDNVAYFMGGGVFKGGQFYDNRGETLTVDQCLFVRNLAGFDDSGQPTDDYCRGGAICCRMHPRIIARHCTFIANRIHDSSYRFGDAFAHYFEYGAWEPAMLCELQNCVFWGEDGVDVQVYSSPGGMAAADNLAAAAGELDLGGLAPVDPVTLEVSPFVDLDSGLPLASGPLVDAALDLGFTSDLAGQPMPVGTGPDIGCLESQFPTAIEDLPVPAPMLTAAPNPFNPRTILAFRLTDRSAVELALHDARGQRVRILVDGILPAGEHRWVWDGRDQTGRDCAGGVYLARLRIDGRPTAVGKLTLVR